MSRARGDLLSANMHHQLKDTPSWPPARQITSQVRRPSGPSMIRSKNGGKCPRGLHVETRAPLGEFADDAVYRREAVDNDFRWYLGGNAWVSSTVAHIGALLPTTALDKIELKILMPDCAARGRKVKARLPKGARLTAGRWQAGKTSNSTYIRKRTFHGFRL